jgi:DNA polymerase/3'-5' exonuclease PolX
MNLKDAHREAIEICKVLQPYCVEKRLRIAGSIRRQKVDLIKDIEIVAIPNNVFLLELKNIVNSKWGEPDAGKFPSKYTKVRGYRNIDFFWCTPKTFGLNFFIRTGPQSFVTRALSVWKALSKGGYSEGAILHNADGSIVETLTEEDVFRALGWNFVRPENRV